MENNDGTIDCPEHGEQIACAECGECSECLDVGFIGNMCFDCSQYVHND